MQGMAIADVHASGAREKNDARIRRVWVLFAIMTAIALAAIVVSLIWRDASHMNNPNEQASQIITIGVTLVWGVLLIFLWSMKLSPLLSYRKYLKETHSGLTRDVEGIVTEVDQDTSFRDGLSFYGIIVNVGDLKDPEDERRLYWDAQLGKPELLVGDRVYVRAHGNDIIGLQRQ